MADIQCQANPIDRTFTIDNDAAHQRHNFERSDQSSSSRVCNSWVANDHCDIWAPSADVSNMFAGSKTVRCYPVGPERWPCSRRIVFRDQPGRALPAP